MAKAELGTKRIDPETGKKFYDLNKDPIISPYTGISYPRSYFENNSEIQMIEEDDEGEALDTVLEKPEFISLEEADPLVKDGDLVEDDLHVGVEADSVFLTTEDEDEDVADILGGATLDEDS